MLTKLLGDAPGQRTCYSYFTGAVGILLVYYVVILVLDSADNLFPIPKKRQETDGYDNVLSG